METPPCLWPSLGHILFPNFFLWARTLDHQNPNHRILFHSVLEVEEHILVRPYIHNQGMAPHVVCDSMALRIQ